MKERLDKVKDHFNTEADIFDSHVIKVIPYYPQMLDALINNITFEKEEAFSAIDVGSGTGTLAYLLKSRFPKAKVKCVDFAPKMLGMASQKLKGFKGITFEQADIYGYKFKGNVDAAVSSLALHHLGTGQDKMAFQEKSFKALSSGGIFINADIILASDNKRQQVCLDKWREFNSKNLTEAQIADRKHKYETEDRPAVLMSEIENLKAAGFKKVEVFWRYYNFAVYGGVKP